jgi:hypothetical protein
VEDFRRCFEEGRFRTSVCPLPLPTMQQMASPRPGDLNREGSGTVMLCVIAHCCVSVHRATLLVSVDAVHLVERGTVGVSDSLYTR